MKLILLQSDKKLNSTYPVPIGLGTEIEVEVRGNINLTHPVFILTRLINNYWAYNYCYVELWQRYYFIKNIEIDGNMLYIYCDEDFLGSWIDELKEQTFFCIRSSVKYNNELTDGLFPAGAQPEYYAKFQENPFNDFEKGYYIIGIANGGNESHKIGCNSYYVLNCDEMTNFMDDLMSKLSEADDLADLADSMIKLMVDPLQYIKSCYYFPCDIDCPTESVEQINFGWWSSDVSAKVLRMVYNGDTFSHFTIAWVYDAEMWDLDHKYLNYPPYSTVTITAYPFGEITVPPDLIRGVIEEHSNICIQIFIDHITGMATLVLTDNELHPDYGENMVPYYTCTCQIGVEIPVGEILQDFAGSVLNTVGAVGGLVTGNIVGAAEGVQNALDNISPKVNTTGEAGGFAQLMLENDWCLKRTYYEPKIYPDLMGEPLEQDATIEELAGGYAIFSDPDVLGPMLKEEKEEIAGEMKRGIFIDLASD